MRNPDPDAPTPASPTTEAAAPPDVSQVIARIQQFTPDSDQALLMFMTGEIGGMVGYAAALSGLYERCVNDKGLDPVAVQGLVEYAAQAAEMAAAMSASHRQFIAVYGEVMAAVDRGVVMPYDGRFWSGGSS